MNLMCSKYKGEREWHWLVGPGEGRTGLEGKVGWSLLAGEADHLSFMHERDRRGKQGEARLASLL